MVNLPLGRVYGLKWVKTLAMVMGKVRTLVMCRNTLRLSIEGNDLGQEEVKRYLVQCPLQADDGASAPCEEEGVPIGEVDDGVVRLETYVDEEREGVEGQSNCNEG